jgi:CRISPR-associated protein Csb2
VLTLGIRYLTGCVVASDVADRNRVEWPPHPGRVFMALAAAHFQTGADKSERDALEWLELQGAPQIHAPDHTTRAVVTQFVPVNDRTGPSNAPIQSVERVPRIRQPRRFARGWLVRDTVYLFWPEAQPVNHFPVLTGLCAKVSRIGHSASLVHMWASESEPELSPNWVPNRLLPTEYFRVPNEGLLGYLGLQFKEQQVDLFFRLKAAAESSDKRAQKSAKIVLRAMFRSQVPVRLRPEISIWQGYARRKEQEEEVRCETVFDPHLLVFSLRRLDGPYQYLDLLTTLQLTGRLRQALLQRLGTEIPDVLSGHSDNGRAELPHIALFPLPFVEHEHAHGGILGVAVAIPRDSRPPDRQRLLDAFAGICRYGLMLGSLGRWALDLPDQGSTTLHQRSWTAAPTGARVWGTVTPYVLDRHVKTKDKVEYLNGLVDTVRTSWQRISQSLDVETSLEITATGLSALLGVPASDQFPPLLRKDGSKCRHVHLILTFDQPVVGPVLLGAGRFRGYGLCRPLEHRP